MALALRSRRNGVRPASLRVIDACMRRCLLCCSETLERRRAPFGMRSPGGALRTYGRMWF